jgi:hypothetical protein
MLALNMLPVERWGILKWETNFSACVPFPAPGGPKSMMFILYLLMKSFSNRNQGYKASICVISSIHANYISDLIISKLSLKKGQTTFMDSFIEE